MTEAIGAAIPKLDAVNAEIQPLFRKISSLSRVIEAGATRTARIIGDLKTFSHPGNEDNSVFDLHEALDMCLNLLGSSLRDRIEVHRQYGKLAASTVPPAN